MSILDKVKDVANQTVAKEVEGKVEEGIKSVTDLAFQNKEFAQEMLSHIKLPDINVNEAINKMFGDGKSQEFIDAITKQVTSFLIKNPKILKEVMKIAAKFN